MPPRINSDPLDFSLSRTRCMRMPVLTHACSSIAAIYVHLVDLKLCIIYAAFCYLLACILKCTCTYMAFIIQVFKKRRLLATCGGIENQPVKLELLKCEDIAAKAKLLEISFCKVTRIHHQLIEDNKQSVVLTINDGRQFSFYSELDTELKRWSKYCLTLQKIPNYSIPELPETKSLKLGKCSDTDKRRLNACMLTELFRKVVL